MYRLNRAPLAFLLLHSRRISNTLADPVVQSFWDTRTINLTGERGYFQDPFLDPVSGCLLTVRSGDLVVCCRCSHKNHCYLVLAIAAVYCLRYSRFAIHHVCSLETLVPLLNTHSLSWTHRHIHGSRRDLGIQIGDRIITYTETCTADTGSGAPQCARRLHLRNVVFTILVVYSLLLDVSHNVELRR